MPEALDELAGRWRSAEARLYPVILSDPEAYQHYVRAVRALADELASVRSLDELAGAYGDAPRRAAAILERSGGPAGYQAAELVAGAAFALRYGELVVELEAAEIERRLTRAAASGHQWVVVREVGNADLGPFGQYRRIEMHVPDGAGLHSYVESQAGTGPPAYVLETLRLDPATGRARGDVEERFEFDDAASWRAAAGELRARLQQAPAAQASPPLTPA